MGGSRTSTQSSGSSSSATTIQPTKEEKEMNKLQLAQFKEADPYLRQVQKSGLQLSNNLLTGGALPDAYGDLYSGINPEVTQSIVDQSLRDIAPGFQQSGLIDSGVRASISARTAGDIRQAAEQFNLNNKMNLLNMGLGGQAQVQDPIQGFAGLLSNRLSTLRNTSTSGSYSGSSTTQQNPGFFNNAMSVWGQLSKNAQSGFGMSGFCWVASEIFGGWNKPDTLFSRIYVSYLAPSWFQKLYMKYGTRVAAFIKDKPVLKGLLKPLFLGFAKKGRNFLNG